MKTIDQIKEENKDVIVAFHVGRGGHFHNPGYLTVLDEKPITHYTGNLFTRFENEINFEERFGYNQTGDKNQKCIIDLIADHEFDELEEKFGITEKMLGEELYYNGAGNPAGLTAKEAETGIGTINVDNEYDTTYTTTVGELSDKELEAIRRKTGFCGLIVEELYEAMKNEI